MEIVQIVGEFGAIGVLIWLVVYVFKTLLPREREGFGAALKEHRDAAERAQEARQASCDKMLREQREAFEGVVMRQREDFKGLLESQRAKEVDFAGRLTASLEGLAQKTEQLTVILLAHDLTVRGPTQGAVGSTRDIVSGLAVSASLLDSAQQRAEAKQAATREGRSPVVAGSQIGPRTQELVAKIRALNKEEEARGEG